MPKIATWTSWSTSSRRESKWKDPASVTINGEFALRILVSFEYPERRSTGGLEVKAGPVSRDFVDLALHVGTVVVGADNAEGARMASEDVTADVLP
jgi:hypothetical protein